MARYSTYEAKARFSDILRRARRGQRVVITYYGEEVAELRPLQRPADTKTALRRLEERGVVVPAVKPRAKPRPLAHRPGALARFLADRE